MLAAGSIQFSSAAFSVADSAGAVPIIMTRTGGSTGAVSVALNTNDGTAVAGTDYNALSGSVSFPDGVMTEKVNLAVLPDPVANLPGRTVNLTLSNPSGGATLGSPGSAVLTITHVATPGDLDGSFGTNGQVQNAPPAGDMTNSIELIAADGSSYATSFPGSSNGSWLDVSKFKPDGTPDTSFGINGIARINLGGTFDLNGYSFGGYGEAPYAAFQPDGKIVVVANISGSSNIEILEVFRLNTDGTLDSTFGQNGVATLAQPSQFSQYIPGGVAVLQSGQIVVTLGVGAEGPEILLADFGPDGSPSLTFGSGGLATTTIGPPSAAGTRSGPLAMPDGTFVVGGTIGSYDSGFDDTLQMVLWRFNADGSLDTAFGSGGLALGPAGPYGQQISLAPNGDILQVGQEGGAGGLIAAYLPAGTLDTSFGSAGETSFSSMYPSVLTFQPNGQIVVAGGDRQTNFLDLARLNADGSVDTGFGRGGLATTPADIGPTAIVSLPGSLILVAGSYDLSRYIAPTSIPTPKITWTNPSGIVYGTALGTTQLDATASVPGTFTYSPAAGTILEAGNGQTLSVAFTPTDTTDYASATSTADINVAQAAPTITWANPANITPGTPLGAAQLDAIASVPGIFTYTPAAGTILNAGANQTLAVAFAPTDTTDYTSATVTVHISVKNPNQTTPTITWANPTGIVYGTALGTSQLDANANVPGTFAYSPGVGTILYSGNNQTLSVTFTPTDATDYTSATSTTNINVAKATPTIVWANPANIIAGTPLGAAQLDAMASAPGTITYTPAAGTILGLGASQTLEVTFTPADPADYTSATAAVQINVNSLKSQPPPTPPHITGIVSVTQTKKGLTSITVGFDEAMDSGSVDNRNLYHVFGAMKKHRKTVYSKSVAIKGIGFDGNSHVTIDLAKPYKGAVMVTVLGGILAANGASSIGDFSAVVD
jgi:uncharacterized delta-60 repeat protein